MVSVVGNKLLIGVVIAALIILLLGSRLALRFRPRRLPVEKFQERWTEVESLCAKADTWPLAVLNADKLLDDALKQRRFKGKTMGERLVSAQRELSRNDSVWFGHKLRNKIVHEEMGRLYRRDVLNAVRGFRDALRDLGALK